MSRKSIAAISSLITAPSLSGGRSKTSRIDMTCFAAISRSFALPAKTVASARSAQSPTAMPDRVGLLSAFCCHLEAQFGDCLIVQFRVCDQPAGIGRVLGIEIMPLKLHIGLSRGESDKPNPWPKPSSSIRLGRYARPGDRERCKCHVVGCCCGIGDSTYPWLQSSDRLSLLASVVPPARALKRRHAGIGKCSAHSTNILLPLFSGTSYFVPSH